MINNESEKSQTASDVLELGQLVRVTGEDTAFAGVEGRVLSLTGTEVELGPVLWPFDTPKPPSVFVNRSRVRPLMVDVEPVELELDRARDLVRDRPADAVRIAYDRGYREGVQEQRREQQREHAVKELAEDVLPRDRVRLKGGHPFSNPMQGTIVDAGRKGAVVDWDSGLRNYVEFDAIEPVDEPKPIEVAASRLVR